MLAVCSLSSVFAEPPSAERHQAYLEFIQQYLETAGRHGDANRGEIELVLNPLEIEGIEHRQYQKLISKGYSEEVAKRHP